MAVIEAAAPEKPKKEPTDDEKRRMKIAVGSLMKAVIRPGGGVLTPSDGDQVMYHCTVRTFDGVVVQSSRAEYGGKGIPIRSVLGKSKLIVGLLEGIPTMQKGEIAMLRMKPQVHYGEEDCPLSPPTDFPKEDELHFEIGQDMLISISKAIMTDSPVERCVLTDDLGVIKQIITEGQGWESPREPYEVKARISARNADGKVLVPVTREEPFFFNFGKSEIPKGLEMGIATMTRQEKAIIYVSRQYLTSNALMPMVEGVEEVHFDVELVHFIQVRDVLGDGRLIKRRVHDGEGEFPMDCPLHDSLLRVHYKGTILDEEKTVLFDTRVDNNRQPLEFRSGEGLVPEGFEMCVRLMLPGELALVTCPPDYAYDKFARPANVPEGAHIQWEIELLGFETPKDWTGLDFVSIMDEAENIRKTGNKLFREGKLELAKAKYEKVLREFNHVNPHDDVEGKTFSNTRNLLHLNVAACYTNMGECRKAIETCNKVIETNPGHVKALYRRGMAFMAAGDFEEAKSDFNKMIQLDKSTEGDATAALLKVKQQEVDKKQRKQFKGLFDKKPGEISEVGIAEDGNKSADVNQKNGEQEEDSDEDNSDNSLEVAEDTSQTPAPRTSFWVRLETVVRRVGWTTMLINFTFLFVLAYLLNPWIT